ncbi:molecular chaperone Skp [Chryseobacterium formosense]|jgi:outer membrane protein|uniref:Molecular chaperone Skp n=1 Tax=Chryseobacterium formosense TaxID=236814 RepID=A0A085Z482_9FLAO|nr:MULTISPECIES: OmpH family outer membrane protein [Chryseobacterium]KFE99245.1 molecular chaperone Skp [Chryseobacterium formosense]OCK52114.1 molecular chaperone Skp [Chryseobacterium sp. CBo1]SFT89977.1 periplasmic chaperone for outer membrane proteins Skp [Chryseobacterium formosense]
MKKLSVLFAAVVMVASVGMAKAQKIATMDVAGILNAMPEKKKADTEITTFVNGKQAEIKKKADAAQAKYEGYTKEAQTKTEAENKARMEEMQKLQQELAQMEDKMRKDATAKQDALFEPIEKKLMEAVTKVAKANGYEYVMDVNSTGLVYKGGPDATAAVKKELALP